MLEQFQADFVLNFIKDDRWRYLTNGLQTTLIVTLCSALLGVIPLLILVLCPAEARALATLCLVPAFMGTISPAPDYMDVLSVIRQVPQGAAVQAANDGLYWYV